MSNSILNKEERLVEVFNTSNQSVKQNEILNGKIRKFKKSENLFKKSPSEKTEKEMNTKAKQTFDWMSSCSLQLKSFNDIVDGDKIINEVTEKDTTLSSSDWSNVLKINNVG